MYESHQTPIPNTEPKWYVLRHGDELRVAHLDRQSALEYHKDGWELGPRAFERREEAEALMNQWRDGIVEGFKRATS